MDERLNCEDHFVIVKHYLQNLRATDIRKLGDVLGIKETSLSEIPGDIVNAWLLMKDDVLSKSGEPTWNSLVNALKKIGHTGVAAAILKEAEWANTSSSSSEAKIPKSIEAARLLESSVQADGVSYSGDIIPQPQDHSSGKQVPSTQGFECHVEDESLKKFIDYECPICHNFLRDPHQMTCCGKNFCRGCIKQALAKSNRCPMCNETNTDSRLFHNKGLELTLYGITVFCANNNRGCEWKDEVRNLDAHLNTNPLAGKYLEGCLYVYIGCPYGCDIEKLSRKDMITHCGIEHKSKDMIAVIHGFEQKLESLERLLKEAQEEVKLLRSKTQVASSICQPIGTVVLIMTNFKVHKRNEDDWFSSAFYTHAQGYKMCLSVCANGFGDGKGTHISVYIYLMKGEFDEYLRWPFQGKITIKLVNQDRDVGHCIKEIAFDDTVPKASNRVQGRERNVTGCGLETFTPNADLQSYKYLKYDSLQFEIARVVIDDPK